MLALNLRPRTIDQRLIFAAAREREWFTWDVTAAFIAAWLRHYSGWTALTYYTHLTSVYRWLNETERLDRNPMATIRRPSRPRPQPRPLTASQVSAVLDGSTGDLRAVMLLALLAGLRVSEIVKIRGEDVNETTLTVLGKGGQLAVLPTHPELWVLAQEYPRHGYWFPSPVNEDQCVRTVGVSAKVARRFRAVGIERGSIHRLRATYGTNLLRSGVNLRIVQTLMRHASLAMTEHYLGVDEDERAAAIRLLAA
jgi:integrase/recombinase XerD